MIRAVTDALLQALLYLSRATVVVEECDVLLPGESDHYGQPVAVREVEQPARRNGVGPDRVDPDCGHGGEIGVDRRGGG